MYTEQNASMPISYVDAMCHLIYIPFYVKSLWLKTFQGNRETMATDNDTILLQYGIVWYSMEC